MFDFTDVQEQSFDALPEGDYAVAVVDCEFKDSKAGNEYLKIQFKVLEGNHENRTIWDNYNVFHSDDKVRNIAMGQLKTLLKHNGVTEMKFDSKETFVGVLQGCHALAKVKVRTQEGYNDSNTISYFKALPKPKGDNPVF